MKTINGKAIAVVTMFVVMAAIIGVLIFMLVSDRENNAQKVITLFEDENYTQAYDTYIELYGRGNSDEELEKYFYNRILDIEDLFDDTKISYEKAVEELEAIEDMRIMSLDDDLDDTMDYIESAHSKATVAGVEVTKAEVNTTNAVSNTTKQQITAVPDIKPPVTTTRQYAQGTTQSYLPTEPLPNERISSTPRISSASTLRGEVLSSSNVNKFRSFTADKAIDGYYDSCWCVNTKSNGGAGAQIRFNLAEKSYVSGIAIINGNLYKPEEEIYYLNGQIKNFTLTFSDGTRKSFTAMYNGTAANNYEYFNFDNTIATDYIILTIDSGYVGTLYTTNVCLGEFKAY